MGVITKLENMAWSAWDLTNMASATARDAKTKLFKIYGTSTIIERHRHRYEVSNRFRDELEKKGLIISALTPDKTLVESIEWSDHPWGIGVQFHPEFQSTPTNPHPLFTSFINCIIIHSFSLL